jgi:glycosyltransferase involved in cell wall biosynthesis
MLEPNSLYVAIPRYGADVGGVTSHIETLIRELRARGYGVGGWFARKPHLISKALLFTGAGFDASRARQANIRRKQRSIRRWLERLDIPGGYRRIIHTHDAFAAQVALQYGQFPLLHTVHGPSSREVLMDFGDHQTSQFIRQIEAEAYRGAGRLIAVDEGQASILEQDFGISRDRITVIPNAVDSAEVERQAEAQRNHPLVQKLAEERSAGKRVVLIPRRLVEKNGVHQAVKALSLLPERVVFWIAGAGPMAETIRSYVGKTGLQRRVRLLGEQRHAQVLGLMFGADAVLVPSVPVHGVVEATSIAALEAMALGKPVVASRIGGLAEMIQDGSTGLLYEADDLEALAKALLILEDKDRAAHIGQNAQRYVQEQWSVAKWGDAVLQEYAKLIP